MDMVPEAGHGTSYGMAALAKASQRPRSERLALVSCSGGVPGEVRVGSRTRKRQRQNGVPEIAGKHY
jgi:hypothetical protein